MNVKEKVPFIFIKSNGQFQVEAFLSEYNLEMLHVFQIQIFWSSNNWYI